MPRPIVWLSRINEIRQSVANTVRSHYGRRDLEILFQIQPRSAGKLIAMLEAVQQSNQLLVPRDALSDFLAQAHVAEDVPALMVQIRGRKAERSRSRARAMVVRDRPEVSLASLPGSVLLERGELRIQFVTLEQLVQDLAIFAGMLSDDTSEFVRRFEPVRREVESAEMEDARTIDREIHLMQRNA